MVVEIFKTASADGIIGFCGSIMGGIITLLSIYLTFRYTEKQRKADVIKNERPFVTIVCCQLEDGDLMDSFDDVISFIKDTEKNILKVTALIKFENIGNGPAIGVRFSCPKLYELKGKIGEIGAKHVCVAPFKEATDELSLCILLSKKQFKLLEEKSYPTEGCNINDDGLSLCIQYSDMSGIRYRQTVSLKMGLQTAPASNFWHAFLLCASAGCVEKY